MGSERDLADLLAAVGLFAKCIAGHRRTIARHAQIAHLPAGTELVKEGEPGDALFVILEGKAIVQHDGIEVNRVGSGAHFGELAIGIRAFRTMLHEFSDLAEQLLLAMPSELRARFAIPYVPDNSSRTKGTPS